MPGPRRLRGPPRGLCVRLPTLAGAGGRLYRAGTFLAEGSAVMNPLRIDTGKTIQARHGGMDFAVLGSGLAS
jgi:hypothetical protein